MVEVARMVGTRALRRAPGGARARGRARGPTQAHRAAARLDDRRLRDGGDHGRVHRAADRRLPRPGDDHAAQGPARPAFALAVEELARRARHGGRRQGRGRRPRRHARRAGPRDGTAAAAPAPAWSSGPGPGVGTVTKPGLPLAVGEPAINPVPRQLMREHVAEVAAALRRRAATSRSPSPSTTARSSPARPGTRGSASSAGCRSSARPASSSPTPARPGSTRSGAASTSPARRAARTSPGAPARPPSGRSSPSTGCPRTRCSTWATSRAPCSSTCAATRSPG